ncbi:hydantoin racemase [Ophiostoma piceae UAMH 11346]|uniref:Hydantoin racemase n=1 Tax=Ophiostoma piceae (strain UAMH 11346) TaxID=1262450 RepID=S3BTC7_OPHP1|nr:hydantoin racemase [Ophiostoma piceae UAMH 11346]
MSRILVLNPNSSTDMTHGVEVAIRGLPGTLTTSTAPSGPASINDAADLAASTEAVLSSLDIGSLTTQYDAVLVACYSVHPLVPKLSELMQGKILVTGIFEASILTALTLLPAYYSSSETVPSTWGVVTTGTFWEEHLSAGVTKFLGASASGSDKNKFAGVYSTGLTAGDFHGGVTQETITSRLKDATKALLRSSPVGCVVMGCAGMAGLEEIIRSAAVEEYGAERGAQVYIIDGVKAGVGLLDQAAKQAALFR